MRKFYFTVLLFSLILFGTSCVDTEVNVVETYYGDKETEVLQRHLNIPVAPYSYKFDLPNHTGLAGVQPNDDLTTLGRVLFYDTNLSKDKSVSCASCHKQELAFSDDVAFSGGIENRATARNSIALGSVLNFSAYYGGLFGIPFFWDNRATSVQDQSKATLANPSEMGMTMSEVVKRVDKLEYYSPLLEKAYGTSNITENMVLNAIGSFVNALTNYNTKFDKALDNTPNYNADANFTSFSLSENRGKAIYQQHCASCHGKNAARPPVTSANNGLMYTYDDEGEGKVLNKQNKIGFFKVPTLRNITRTAPYMHNGMFATLEEVIEHYSTGIKNHTNLSSQLKNTSGAIKFNFTAQDKADLMAFFKTLEDEKITTDIKFSDPFLR